MHVFSFLQGILSDSARAPANSRQRRLGLVSVGPPYPPRDPALAYRDAAIMARYGRQSPLPKAPPLPPARRPWPVARRSAP